MKFVYISWLWALLLIPFLYLALVWDQKNREKLLSFFVQREVWKSVAPHFDPKSKFKKGKLWLVAFFFLVLALARPQWGKHEEVIPVTGLDILIVLDVSNSMEVEDVVPNRLKKSKHLIRSLIERLKGDRVGVVPFAGSSYVACPLTTDLDYVLETVEVLNPSVVTHQGTNIGIGLDTAVRALDRAAVEGKKDIHDPISSRVILLISDGENHEQKAIENARKIRDSGTKLFVIGMGTEKGGPIPVRDPEGVLRGYKKDRRGNAIVSQFKSDALMEIAAAGGGRYWSSTPNEAELEELLQDLGVLNRTDYAERRYVVYEERFQIPLAIALLFFFLEMSLPGRILFWAGLLISLGSSFFDPWGLSQAVASEKSPKIEAYIENERGIKAYQKGNVDEAKQKFGAAQALDPLRPELQFNQGVMRMQEGNVDGAVQDFAGALEGAREWKDSSLMGQSAFNLGGALSQKGDLPGAVRAYLEAIEAAKASKNLELENDARKNLELLEEVRKKQKEQQKNQKKEEGQGGENSEQKEDPANEGNKDQKQEKNESKNYKDPSKSRRKNDFQSQKLSKEDAERVMSELSSREKELQGKLKKQKGNPASVVNDW